MKMKDIFLAGTLICILFIMGTTAFAAGDGTEKVSEAEIKSSLESTEEVLGVNDLLRTEEDVQYYAYLDLNSADPSLASVILKAREKIIFRQSWVADGLQGFAYNSAENKVEEVPQFSELFPEDWSIPVLPTGVDLSYYGK